MPWQYWALVVITLTNTIAILGIVIRVSILEHKA